MEKINERDELILKSFNEIIFEFGEKYNISLIEILTLLTTELFSISAENKIPSQIIKKSLEASIKRYEENEVQ